MGTHAGIIHILDLNGNRIKSYKPHMASVVDISLDATADFVATASIDGGIFNFLTLIKCLPYLLTRTGRRALAIYTGDLLV